MDDYNKWPQERSDASGTEDSESWSPSLISQGSVSGKVVNYYFPVEVVVAGGLAPQDRESIQAAIFEDLHDAINRRLA